MEKESFLEKFSGSLPVSISATLLAAFSGNPITALLPLLTGTLAYDRHKKRVENAIREIEKILKSHEQHFKELTDSQYTLINEAVVTVFKTIDEEKLNYLKTSIENSFQFSDINIHKAERLARLIRDITSDEASFLLKYHSYDFIFIGTESKSERKTLLIAPGGKDAAIVDGLASLGLLTIGGQTWDELFHYKFSNIVPELVRILT
jgi:hypothetical protein